AEASTGALVVASKISVANKKRGSSHGGCNCYTTMSQLSVPGEVPQQNELGYQHTLFPATYLAQSKNRCNHLFVLFLDYVLYNCSENLRLKSSDISG
ncbi:hypothetical protein C0J52_11391, partial [Blattella germanica]